MESTGTTVVRQCNFTRGTKEGCTHTAIHLHQTEGVSIEHNDFHGYHEVIVNTGEIKGAQVCSPSGAINTPQQPPTPVPTGRGILNVLADMTRRTEQQKLWGKTAACGALLCAHPRSRAILRNTHLSGGGGGDAGGGAEVASFW